MLYQKIKVIAKAKGVSIAELERVCKISQGSICKWGEVKPSFDKVVLVVDYLGISLDDLAAVYREKQLENIG